MNPTFTYDVFLSHSSKDKSIVRTIAEQLRHEGLKVWYDEWEIRPGDNIPARIEEGLEASRVLVLFMSQNAFDSEWARLESGTFRFRDPVNRERRFLPVRIDNSEIRPALAQFAYIDLRDLTIQASYVQLIDSCRPPNRPAPTAAPATTAIDPHKSTNVAVATIYDYAFSADGKTALLATKDGAVHVFDVTTRRHVKRASNVNNGNRSVLLSRDGAFGVVGAFDGSVAVLGLTSNSLTMLLGHSRAVTSLAFGGHTKTLFSASADKTIRYWDTASSSCLCVYDGHTGEVLCISCDSQGRYFASASADRTIRVWDQASSQCIRVIEGHTGVVTCVAWTNNDELLVSGSDDRTVRLWDPVSGRCQAVLEGHQGGITALSVSPDGRMVASGSQDTGIRLWDLKTTRCLADLKDHLGAIWRIQWVGNADIMTGDHNNNICRWTLPQDVLTAVDTAVETVARAAPQVQYTNAKVLLVGDSSAGKTGLALRLALNQWRPTDSTVGAWATHWKVPISTAEGIERDIWLWDFGGQADQRLIHQLYMEDTALAVLVFDGQRENLYETLGQWTRDLSRASRRPVSRLLVAGRVDAGGLRTTSKAQMTTFASDRGYGQYLETSAKTGEGCEELREAILSAIHWDNIPWRSSPLLFRRLKEAIVALKDEGRVLLRFNELRDSLRLRLAGQEGVGFSDEELRAVISLLAGPGVVWELEFGSWILLQPERINAYAQAVIQSMRSDPDERGCIPEGVVLEGRLAYQSSMARLEPADERFVLLAMHQTLVERGLCLREHTESGPLLVFPSYYRRERPERAGHPTVLVTYQFNGLLDEIYATLVVRLHHTGPFQQEALWRYAADFRTLTGKQLGLRVTRRAEGGAELDVYFDAAITMEEKIIFSRYVHEHLRERAKDVVRLRHYVCPHCGTAVGNREVAMSRLQKWLETELTIDELGNSRVSQVAKPPTIVCSMCEERVPLWDELENWFASREIGQRVEELQQQSTAVLESASHERALVGEVISTVTLAGQHVAEYAIALDGLDMVIELLDDQGELANQRIYLQLRTGSEHVRSRDAKNYMLETRGNIARWRDLDGPVYIIVRAGGGEIGWIEVGERGGAVADSDMAEIEFRWQRFDVMAVRAWREKALADIRR